MKNEARDEAERQEKLLEFVARFVAVRNVRSIIGDGLAGSADPHVHSHLPRDVLHGDTAL